MTQAADPVDATLETWHALVADRAVARLGEVLHPDVVFRSPAFFKPYAGRDVTAAILAMVTQEFQDFAYHRSFRTPDGRGAVLEFSARIGERTLEGVDILAFDAAGLITEFKVMIRPLNALTALGDAMKARFAAWADGAS